MYAQGMGCIFMINNNIHVHVTPIDVFVEANIITIIEFKSLHPWHCKLEHVNIETIKKMVNAMIVSK
jgi:hypothetical protein